MTDVTFTLTHLDGSPRIAVPVSVTLRPSEPSNYTSTSEIGGVLSTVTDSNGNFSFSLTPQSELVNPNSYYEIWGVGFALYCVVPVSSSPVELNTLLIDPTTLDPAVVATNPYIPESAIGVTVAPLVDDLVPLVNLPELGTQIGSNFSITGTFGANLVKTNKVYQKPYKLLIYYGIPQGVNSVYLDSYAAQLFASYDYVVLGAGLEVSTNTYYASTLDIISTVHTLNPNTTIFGYIDLGVTTSNFTLPQIDAFVNQWITAGATSIFLDCAGYDFQVPRSRLNTALEYIHSQNMGAIVNAFNPDDVMGTIYDAVNNPTSTPTQMGSTDYYLLESWVVNTTAYTTTAGYNTMYGLKTVADKAATYRQNLGVKLLATGIVDYSLYSPDEIIKFFKMTEAAAICYNIDGYGIGAPYYSSEGNDTDVVVSLPYNPEYPTYFNISIPPLINNPWTQLSRPDLPVVFHNDYTTLTYWWQSQETTTLGISGIDSTIDAFTLNGPFLSANNNIRGISVSLPTSSTALAVSFSTAHPDTHYAVVVTPSYATTHYVTNKTVSGFTINFGTAAPSGAVVDWMTIR
jgi:hypothetical protein